MQRFNITIVSLFAILVLVFPFLNPCSDELLLCNGTHNGLTVIDYYGVTLYLP